MSQTVSRIIPGGRLTHGYLSVSLIVLATVPAILSVLGTSYMQAILATALSLICFYPIVQYVSRKGTEIPTLPTFCAAYAIQFALPILTREATIDLAYNELHSLEDHDVVMALLMAIVGICSFLAGYYWFHRTRLKQVAPQAVLQLNKAKAVIY